MENKSPHTPEKLQVEEIEELVKAVQKDTAKSIFSGKHFTISIGVLIAILAAALPFMEMWGQLSTLEERMNKKYDSLVKENERLEDMIHQQEDAIIDLEKEIIRIQLTHDRE